MSARASRRADDLRLLLELERELWRTARAGVVCTFGQITRRLYESVGCRELTRTVSYGPPPT